MPQSNWQLNNQQARLCAGNFAAQVDLGHPARGLHAIHCSAAPLLESHLFGVHWGNRPAAEPREVADCYVRGGDLIATYVEQPEYPFSPQIYWRAIEAASSSPTQCELWVSVQTRLLDAQPELTATTRVRAVEVLHLVDGESGQFTPLPVNSKPSIIQSTAGTGCLLLRLPGGQASYLEMVHPQDFPQGRLAVTNSGDWIELAHTLIACTMEKGVIIRTRLRSCILDRANDTAIAAQLYEIFAGAELPLSV